AADGRPIPEAHGFFIAQDGEQSRSVVLCLRLQGQAICLEDHGPAALSAARPSSRRSALRSVHWTDLTRYAGRASPCKKPRGGRVLLAPGPPLTAPFHLD